MPVLETKRLLLREFHPDDLQDLVSWQRDSGAAFTEGEAHDFLNFCLREYVKWGIGPWGMLLRKTAVMIGSCGFYHIDSRNLSADVNYFVTPQHRGHGLAPEALEAVLEFGFGKIGLVRIQARCTAGNLSSERAAKKAGMIFERMIGSDDGSKEERGYKLYTAVRKAFAPRTSR